MNNDQLILDVFDRAYDRNLASTAIRLLLRVQCGITTQSEIARASNVSTAAIAGVADTLVKRGLLIKTRPAEAKDQRNMILSLTPAGTDLLAQITTPTLAPSSTAHCSLLTSKL